MTDDVGADRPTRRVGPRDIVYIVGHDTGELRFSLRSLANIPHGNVWVVGVRPKWMRNVHHLPVRQNRTKFQNSTANVLAAARCDDITDQFIYMNDDFFAVRRTRVPNWHLGELTRPTGPKLARARQGASYREGRLATWHMLTRWGIDRPLNYEVHAPMVIDRARFVEMMDRVDRDHSITALHKRTVYGNLFEVGGRQVRDPKSTTMSDTWDDDQSWVSTNNRSFDRGAVGRRLRALFPDPSPYEEV